MARFTLLHQKKSAKEVKRLRLVAKSISDNPKQIKEYLDRVKSFRAIQNPRLTRVAQVAEVGGRHVVVSDRPTGEPVARWLNGKPQSDESVKQLVAEVGEVLADLEMADLKHGSIDTCTLCRNDKQQWCLDLPSEFGFAAVENGEQSGGSSVHTDVGALAIVAGRMLEGKSAETGTTANETANKLLNLHSNPQASLSELKSLCSGAAVEALQENALPNIVAQDPSVVSSAEVVEAVDIGPENVVAGSYVPVFRL